MPEGIEVDTKELQDTLHELHEEREHRKEEEHHAEWTRFIAMTTAVLAVVAAVAALQAGSLANESLFAKEESIVQQAKASDGWSYYQAKGIKGEISGLKALMASGAAATAAGSEKARYKKEQEEISKEAKEHEAKRDEFSKESEDLLARHEKFALVVTLTQVAIALSAIAALTKLRSVWFGSMLVGFVGVVLFLNNFLPHGK